MIIDFK